MEREEEDSFRERETTTKRRRRECLREKENESERLNIKVMIMRRLKVPHLALLFACKQLSDSQHFLGSDAGKKERVVGGSSSLKHWYFQPYQLVDNWLIGLWSRL